MNVYIVWREEFGKSFHHIDAIFSYKQRAIEYIENETKKGSTNSYWREEWGVE